MDAGEAITTMGGAATLQELRPCCTKREIREAVEAGRLVRAARGSYIHRSVTDSEAARARLSGTLVCLSAEARSGVHVLHSDVRGLVTDRTTTVIDCARRLPFGEALTVADAALRRGVDPTALADRAAGQDGPPGPRGRGSAFLPTGKHLPRA